MQKPFLFILLILLTALIPNIQAQTSVGFFIGPNYSLYKVGWTSSKGEPGLGFQGGISIKTNPKKISSFRLDLYYSMLTTDATIFMDADENSNNTNKIVAQYLFHSINLIPQLQLNFLKNRSLFSTIGIGPRTVTAYGKGTATSRSGRTSEFNGNDYNFIFYPVTLFASVSVGYQNIKLGNVSGFIEAGARGDILSFTNNTVYTSTWRALSISINLGFYLAATKK
jgi:hypothetical protein